MNINILRFKSATETLQYVATQAEQLASDQTLVDSVRTCDLFRSAVMALEPAYLVLMDAAKRVQPAAPAAPAAAIAQPVAVQPDSTPLLAASPAPKPHYAGKASDHPSPPPKMAGS